jgi:hypothetical protein
MEKIETVNQRLKDFFGCPYDEKPLWRLSWSDDQYEMRYGTYEKFSPSGVWLGQETGWRLVPKYKQYMPHQWVLERITPVPEGSDITGKLSYEPIWGFRDLEPEWDMIKYLIDAINQAINRSPYAKYKHPEEEYQTQEAILQRVSALEKNLFGDESDLTKALNLREAVVVPGPQTVENVNE